MHRRLNFNIGAFLSQAAQSLRQVSARKSTQYRHRHSDDVSEAGFPSLTN